MSGTLPDTILRGAAAGTLGSIVQAVVGKTEDIAFLPSHEDSNIAPRLMDRLASMRGDTLSTAERWALGTIFHVAYGAGWGKLYAVARERMPVHPAVGGALLGAVIYSITFTSWGGAVQTGAERTPERRTARMGIVAVSVALAFGLTTAYAYESIRTADE